MTVPPPLVVITGPTATGKTEVGINVALACGGEIVSADSMMVYRGMDIGTAKPSASEMRGVPHHLIDVVDPDEEFNVARYQQLAGEAIVGILGRKRVPLLVGGTGLYIRSVVEDYRFPVRADRRLRNRLQEAAELYGCARLHRHLAVVDPVTARRLHPNDQRRIIRALEVYYQSGIPFSRYPDRRDRAPKYLPVMFGLNMERGRLYRRIEDRVDAMIRAGLVREVQSLLEKGYGPELVAMKGLGYKEIAAHLRGSLTLEEAIHILKRNTRRFAKRQLTWFRRDEQIRWLDVEECGGPVGAAREIVGSIEQE
ncbi:tRNA (adenosine(37)-N6)-dimethylallyltransferase MiaA [Candidatus Desulforudis audaxviator]|uniref:tRNA dimethylallyltransferase n=1 Tax=Desulforudis audaxviator (strain MP104C) TaxID=477974 RepID=MIAA_DESAP|nr:tRNA (adenosine(37)-N6)-dimethylallyltransferase MiaA [Candidatus Desulforudis audaxviator]B1I295.1 RecName: Full=tRNA dimethylallyltransferase; AltName: Full=Dimethylallyl diphosphate:tRNA dimethylallyltransferase; Short=DMAPP:tRNA dimethylallyltransferase; Short=DMATase; AltName: Full=Isopentenyl-diphosphate:tRNA isopentenyltransferase; Short=IPP transferase; Short=IPPT; Short=IPTase [Candidatus Desulforudis audaxviator MP104C]ACA59097.1 tRNA delta(2)-isopentenylpyrophosphate transferase [Ca